MNIFSRIWMAAFGPYAYVKAEDRQILLQRGPMGHVLVTANDDCYGIQIALSPAQARELTKFLLLSNRSMNKDNVIRLPENK